MATFTYTALNLGTVEGDGTGTKGRTGGGYINDAFSALKTIIDNLALADISDAGALAAHESVGTTELDANAVTYAKIQNITATARILGRNSAGAGIVEEISESQFKTLFNLEIGTDVAAEGHTHSAYIPSVSTPTLGNFPQLDASGYLVNSAYDENSFSLSGHDHAGVYEPAFSKNTGFNLVLGSGSGQVAEGNHTHSGVYEPIDATLVRTTDVAYNATEWDLAYGWGDHGLEGYLTAEVNDLTAAVTWANIPIANVPTGTTGSTVALGNHTHTGVYEPADSTLVKATITAIASGELLKWSGTAWINQTLAEAGIAAAGHDHSGVYEPAFSKNTGFNLVLGTGSGQVAEGNHTHTGVYEPADATILKDADIGVTVAAFSHNHSGVYEPADATLVKATITAIANGELLRWNGSAWINNTLAEAGIAATGHTHTGVYEPADATILKDADIGVTIAAFSHTHTGVYEPAFSKNTAFNKNFGTSGTTVAYGNHNHTGVYNLYVHPNHSGDVTSTGDGATVIANDAVTYAKMQNVVNDERVLGRVSGANGVVEELTQAQVLTFLGITNTPWEQRHNDLSTRSSGTENIEVGQYDSYYLPIGGNTVTIDLNTASYVGTGAKLITGRMWVHMNGNYSGLSVTSDVAGATIKGTAPATSGEDALLLWEYQRTSGGTERLWVEWVNDA